MPESSWDEGPSTTTERLFIRRMEMEDLTDLLEYDGHPMVDRFRTRNLFSEEKAKEFLCHQRDLSLGTEEWLYLAIILQSQGKMIGTVCCRLTSETHRQGDIGWFLNPGYHGHGYATEAASAMIDLCFSRLNLHRMTARCYELNEPSVRLMDRLGMRREGLFVETAKLGGVWHNEYLYAILRRQWVQQRQMTT